MIQTLMLQSLGNNESAWARILSRNGRVFLYKFHHVTKSEQWHEGKMVSASPPEKAQKVRSFNIGILDFLTVLKLRRLARSLVRDNGNMDVVIGTSTYFALTGLLMKKRGMTRKCVSFLQDYYPYNRGPLPARLWRWYHYRFSRFVAKRADEVWSVSPRIHTGNINPNHFVIPIWIDDHAAPPDGRTDIAYIGNPIEDHCLPWLFDICGKHKIRLHIAGTGPYLDSIRRMAPDNTIFHGFVHEPAKMMEILGRCFCGYAVYRDTSPQNYAYYGVPSKIYNYLAYNVPVVTTNITEWSAKVRDNRLGRLTEPVPAQVEEAILEIRANYRGYYDSINAFRKDWNKGVEKFMDERMAALIENE